MESGPVKKWLLTMVVTFAVAIVLLLSLPGIFSNTTAGFAQPFLSLSQKVDNVLRGVWRSATGTVMEHDAYVRQLERENQELRLELARTENAIAENRELRKFHNIQPPPGWSLTVAPLIARDPVDWNRSFRIGGGRRDGIRVGGVVLANGCVVGRISSVGATSAAVITVADPACRLSVRVRGTTAVGVVRGLHLVRWYQKPLCLVDYLPRDVDYRHGQIVETSGLGGTVPAGLPLGRILPWSEQQTAHIMDSAYAQLSVEPLQPFDSIRHVFVLSRKE